MNSSEIVGFHSPEGGAVFEEVIAQYTNADEDSRLVRQLITRMEFDTTLNVLARFTTKPVAIAELGAATGRYSLHYATQGHNVTAVELVPDQVAILTRKAAESGLSLAIHEANARSVPMIADASQDVVAMLGPLYHLQSQDDREAAINEAHRILKPGGIIAVAYISRFFVAGLFAQLFPALVTSDILQLLASDGIVTSPAADRFFRAAYFATPNEMEHLVGASGFSIVDHVATDGLSRYAAAGVNSFTAEQYDAWLQYHLHTCREPSLLGASNHGLVIGRK